MLNETFSVIFKHRVLLQLRCQGQDRRKSRRRKENRKSMKRKVFARGKEEAEFKPWFMYQNVESNDDHLLMD